MSASAAAKIAHALALVPPGLQVDARQFIGLQASVFNGPFVVWTGDDD